MDATDLAVAGETLSTRDLASLCRVSITTVDRWARLKVGPTFIRLPGRRLYPRAEVDRWLEQRLRKSTEPSA